MASRQRLSPAGGAAILALTTAFWGSSFVVIKQISPGMPASVICVARFAIAAIALSPFVRRDRKVWRYGIELSAWLFAGYATQAVALRYTSVNRCAFITATYVVFVPLLAAFFGHRVRPIVWAAAAVALGGCGLLCGEGGGPNAGDLWSLGTAITWSVYIFRMEAIAVRFQPLPLAVSQLIPVALFSGIWSTGTLQHPITFHWPALIYLGLAATAATTWLQAVAQQVVPSPQAAVIFTLEPVFASIFGYIMLGERLTIRGIIGAALIIAAAIAGQAQGITRKQFENTEISTS
jgi:drug/metabolite transporter (DMT)-like permease